MTEGKKRVVRHKRADGTTATYTYSRKRPAKPTARTVGSVILEYRQSPDFRNLAANTKRSYLRALREIEEYRETPIADIRMRHILRMRDAWQDKPATANQIVAVWSVLMKFAVRREYRDNNPAHAIPDMKTGEYRRWPVDAIEFALGSLPEYIRRAVVLGLYTGQRAGDCCAMLWSDYDGEAIGVVQQKTGARLWIPCHAVLRAELAEWKKDAGTVTILANGEGKPWQRVSFLTRVSRTFRKHRELDGLVFHGLRRTAASMLAEAGCTTHEIAAITGHRTLQMIQHYAKEAEQRERARAAIVKLETHGERARVKSGQDRG